MYLEVGKTFSHIDVKSRNLLATLPQNFLKNNI